ncbi:hypothetical protein D4764_12G0010930 [Xyrichtys novacula]|uniref:SGNH hydrolase-type esterase domain-containing protein n=1 Tax=Xyrichtys novacula TaxID=13765 RepID=A0AAV1F8G5_XYRNO|nr:hypothetical protein D4764_12G0010930 [Xyrichtys novacula]
MSPAAQSNHIDTSTNLSSAEREDLPALFADIPALDAASSYGRYHLQTLKNNRGLVISSEGTVRVIRAAEWVIRQASAGRRSQPIKPQEALYIVRKRIGCLQKSKEIAELERRISSLHWIRGEELLLDSMLTLGAGLPVDPAELDSTIPAAAAPRAPPAPAGAAAASGSPPSPAEAPAEPARPQPMDAWLTQGARPRRVPAPALDFTPHPRRFNIRSSTPRSTAAAKRRTSLKPHFDLQLSSRYDVLSIADFPLLPGRPDPGPADAGRSAASPPSAAGNKEMNGGTHTGPRRPPPPPHHADSSTRCKPFREPLRRRSAGNRRSPAPTFAPPPHPRPLFPPTMAIIGDSIVRHVHFFNAVTHCFPGATVPTLLHKLPELLGSLPSSITRLVLHLGFNDTSSRQSEVTKDHFKKLFKVLTNCGKSVFISGPLPSFDCGIGRFSRLLSLNTWLHSACPCGFRFIDNFNLFWNCSPFYKADRVHPSRLGSRVLGDNIRHAVHHYRHHQLPLPSTPSTTSYHCHFSSNLTLCLNTVSFTNTSLTVHLHILHPSQNLTPSPQNISFTDHQPNSC